MAVMVLRQHFQLMNCEGSEALETSSSLAVKVSVLALVLQLWQENLPSFCRV